MKAKILGALVAGGSLALAVLASPMGPAAASNDTKHPGNDARFATAGSATPAYGARTIPHWSFTYTDPTNNQSYTATMVGTDPRQGGSTTVKTEIIPLQFSFVDAGQDLSAVDELYGYTTHPLDWIADPTAGGSSSDVSRTLASPIFQDNTYDSDLGGDTGQY